MHENRITFTADPFVRKSVKDLAKKEGKSISSAVNDLLRLALEGKKKSGTELHIDELPTFDLHFRPDIDQSRFADVLNEMDLKEFDRSRH